MVTSHYFEYDLGRQRTATADPTGRTTFGYDSLGRRISRSNPQGFNLAYDYDAVGNRTRLQDPDGVNLYYRYDAANRMVETSSATYGGYITYYEYDLANECVHEGRQNKTISYYGFDAAGRTSLIEHRDDGSVVYERYDFDRDEAGNILRRPRASDTDTTYWNYDPAGRITRELWKTGFAGANLYAFEYAYDPAGNRQSKRNAINSQTTYWEYDQADETTLQRSGTPVTVYFTYDANGNLSVEHDVDPSAGLTYYEYDPRNLLTRVGFPAPLSEDKFTFNALGERVSRIDSTDKRQYVWDGLDVILETDMGGPPQTLQRLVKGYTPTRGIGSYALQDLAGKLIYPYKDQVGTTILHTDTSAAEVNNYRNMDAWGVQFETPSETFPQEYRFTGKQTDPDFVEFNSQNRRYHFPARFYLPSRGIFSQVDPLIWLAKRTAFSYSYVRANPLAWVDPLGRQDKPPRHIPTDDELDTPVPLGPGLFGGTVFGISWWQAGVRNLFDLCDKCCKCHKCTVDQCKQEAMTIMDAYLKAWNDHHTKDPWWDPFGTSDYHAGFYCYQWRHFVWSAIYSLPLKCWSTAAAGWVRHPGEGYFDLKHNWVIATACRDSAECEGDCTAVLDPWKNKAPSIFTPGRDGTHGYKCNFTSTEEPNPNKVEGFVHRAGILWRETFPYDPWLGK